ncbi:hypothetical protein SAMN05428949_2994 [Chitinophaga sp. YR627]|uniref:import component protein n=1 Tax=Chitinophaga sp. YR627 TaxID=1881041 RepID=UPI0008E6281C|nr:import component protein [Chitinophaga sp. YR627]SFN48373.1 hypothetical protein SAMN05428949_2994 [Chitinophaga sp. YR627]
MKNQTLAIIAYITLIGWLYTYVRYRNSPDKSRLVQYHLNQALGIFIFAAVLWITIQIISAILPSIGSILAVAGLLPLVLMTFGAVAASKDILSPVPGVGKLFENRFNFLN